MNRPRILIAGTASGVGKTTITTGLLAALKKRGLKVQSFKIGPDFLDPQYHQMATGRAGRNLDSFFMSSEQIVSAFLQGSRGNWG